MITEEELRKLISTNRKVDSERLDQFIKSLEEIRATRDKKPERRLASPLARKRVTVGEPDNSDPRAIDLRGRR